MAKVFRAWDVHQDWLLRPSLHQFVSPEHKAHFTRDTVWEALDLSAILTTDTEERGRRSPSGDRRAPPHDQLG